MAKTTRRTLKERRESALAEVEAAKAKLAALETAAAERIGKMAIRAGLVDLELSDDQLAKEFDAIASKFRNAGKSADTFPGSGSSSQAGEG